MTPAAAVLILILLVVEGVLVDGVVREVHVHVVHVFWRGRLIRMRREPRESFFENVGSQRIDSVE